MSEYTYHPPITKDTDVEFVIGVNDDFITEPSEGESLWSALVRLERDHSTWKLDIEVRDDDGCTMVVVPLFEKDAP